MLNLKSRRTIDKEHCELTLNGFVIDRCHSESLALAIFTNFSGESHTGSPEISANYNGIEMSRKEWVNFQSERLQIDTLGGDLTLTNTYTGEQLAACCVL